MSNTYSFCQLCGQSLRTEGIRVKHPDWPPTLSLLVCNDCYQTKPSCPVCSLPIDSASQDHLCPTCADAGRHCRSCFRSLSGDSIKINGVGCYCPDCHKTRQPCSVCGAPLTDQCWQLSDGRISCAYCHATAIYDPEIAAKIFASLSEVIQRDLGLALNVPTGLALVDRTQLADIICQQAEHLSNHIVQPSLDPENTLGIYARRGLRRGIYIQNGLPRTLLLQIAAHEFAHAWQGENCPLLRDPLMREGFAEWVAYKLLGAYGFTAQQKLMSSRNDLYGKGLSWALDLERVSGIQAVIMACRKAD